MNQKQLDELGEGLKEFRRVQRENDEAFAWLSLALLGAVVAIVFLIANM